MDKSYYILLLGNNSKTDSHELILKCLDFYGYYGTRELSIDELRRFCKSEKLL